MVQSISTANGDHQTCNNFLCHEGKSERCVATYQRYDILDQKRVWETLKD